MDFYRSGLQIKAQKAGEPGRYEGHFSVFDSMDDGGDRMRRGAFVKTIAERGHRVRPFFMHYWDRLLGPPPDTLAEDSKGLFAAGRLTLASFWGREAWALIEDGALNEGSIGYEAVKWTRDNDTGTRDLLEVKLYEISPVPIGMHPETDLQAIKSILGNAPQGDTLYNLIARAAGAGGALPPHDSEVAPADQVWDRREAVKGLIGAHALAASHAWRDPAADASAAAAYLFPHHDSEGAAVLAGLRAAARDLDKSGLPESDRAAVRRHLGAHFEQLGEAPPWQTDPDLSQLAELAESVYAEIKSGRVLSAASLAKVQSALESLAQTVKALTDLLQAAEPDQGKILAIHSALTGRARYIAAVLGTEYQAEKTS